MWAVQAKMGRLLGYGGGWVGSGLLLVHPGEIGLCGYAGQKPTEKERAAGESGPKTLKDERERRNPFFFFQAFSNSFSNLFELI